METMSEPKSAPYRLMLTGGPADDVRIQVDRWSIIQQQGGYLAPPAELPQHVWLCRIQWGIGEMRLRLEPEISRGKSALYWLEHERDQTPGQTPDGAYLYSHIPDDEVEEYLPGATQGIRGIFDTGSTVQQHS
jgi:hypothetical protein